MSRLWDTPEYWACSEADEMLREMANVAPGALADSFERSAAIYDGEPEMAATVVAELRRRAAAGIRFWAGPHLLDPAPPAATSLSEGATGEPVKREITD